MRRKLSFFLLCGVAIIIVVLAAILSPQMGDEGVVSPEEDSPEVETSPRYAANSEINKPDPDETITGFAINSQINGLLIDNKGGIVSGGDILFTRIGTTKACNENNVDELAIDADTRLVNSDSRGRFTLPLGSHEFEQRRVCLILHASAPGFMTTKLAIDEDSLDNAVVEIELQPYRRLQGKVLTPSGEYSAGAEVLLWPHKKHSSNTSDRDTCKKGESDITVTKSDENGGFVFDAIAGEPYCIQARQEDWASSDISLIGGDTTPTSIDLRLRSAQQFSGTVNDLQGLPVSGLTLQLVAFETIDEKTLSYSARTNGAGEFLFPRLDYGEYKVNVDDDRYMIANPEFVAISDKALGPLMVTVFPVSMVKGSVVDANNTPITNVQISVYSPYLPDLSLSQANSDGRGEFRIPSLHQSKNVRDSLAMANEFALEKNQRPVNTYPDKLCIHLYHSDFLIKEISLNSREDEIDLQEIVLPGASRTMPGKVRGPNDDGLPAVLTFRAAFQKRMQHRQPPQDCGESPPPIVVTADANGNFRFHPPHLGEYEVSIETKRYSLREQEIVIDGNEETLLLRIN